jgi:hypothetical protein
MIVVIGPGTAEILQALCPSISLHLRAAARLDGNCVFLKSDTGILPG